MGDRTSVIYEVGGAFGAAELDQLATILHDCGAWSLEEEERGEHPSEWIRGAIAEKEALSFELHDVNYASDDVLEGFLKDHGAHWRKQWSPGGGYGSGQEEHDPSLDKPIELDCDFNGDAVLPLATVLVLVSDPLVEPRNWLARWADLSARQIPPLVEVSK